MQVGRELFEDPVVRADQAEEGRTPGGEGDRVDQGEPPVDGAVQEMGPQRDGTAEVVGDDGRGGQTPVGQQLGEDPALRAQRHVLPLELGGDPVPRHVPDVHLMVPGQLAGDPPPDVRGERRPVAEDDRRRGRVPEPLPAHLARAAAVRPGQLPVAHAYALSPGTGDHAPGPGRKHAIRADGGPGAPTGLRRGRAGPAPVAYGRGEGGLRRCASAAPGTSRPCRAGAARAARRGPRRGRGRRASGGGRRGVRPRPRA